MNEEFQYFYEEFGPIEKPQQVSETQLKKYKGYLPAALLEFWKEVGWGGYAGGLLWSTNPEEFAPAVQAWLSGSGQFGSDDYHVFARDAFGNLYVWGKNSGNCITIHPLSSSVVTTAPERFESDSDRDLDIASFFVTRDKDDYDFKDLNEKPLFQRALKKLGPLESDEMYAFEPALCIGGAQKIDNLVKVKMIEHLVLLSQLSGIEVVHIDVSKHL
jgi:hypothetical protein